MTNIDRIQTALEHWSKRFPAKPDRLAIDPEDPYILWLCADFYRQQVVLDYPVSQGQVDEAYRKMVGGGVLALALDQSTG
jgi:hypothetical protein